jgi:hypothetical protein
LSKKKSCVAVVFIIDGGRWGVKDLWGVQKVEISRFVEFEIVGRAQWDGSGTRGSRGGGHLGQKRRSLLSFCTAILSLMGFVKTCTVMVDIYIRNQLFNNFLNIEYFKGENKT